MNIRMRKPGPMSILAMTVLLSSFNLENTFVPVEEIIVPVEDLMPSVKLDQLKRVRISKYNNQVIFGFDVDYNEEIDIMAFYTTKSRSISEDEDYEFTFLYSQAYE